MLKDLRYGIRTLVHAKGWTAVIVMSLALGIGGNTALFSAVNSLLLKTVPLRDPHTLVRFRSTGPNEMVTNSSGYGTLPRETRATFSYPMFQQLVVDNRTMTDVIACAPFGRVNVVVNGQAEIASAFISTGNYYRVLGITTSLGRTLTPDDDQPAAPPAAVISHRYWVSRFGSDPHALNKTVRLNGLPVTIVGVTSPDYTGIQQTVGNPPDLSIPLALDPQLNPGPSRLGQPTYWWLQIMGRVKAGVTPAMVQANLDTVFQHTAREGLDTYLASLSEHDRSRSNNANRIQVPHLLVEWGRHGIYDAGPNDVRAVAILSAVVILVLLIVCANVANLLLSRATVRRREIAVRLAIGATRARLVRQLLTESVLLAALGGALGIVVADWGQPLLPGPAGQATPLNWRVLGFVLGVTLITGVAFGLAPALRATRVNLSAAMKEQSRSVIRSRSFVGKALLIVQVAVSLVLLIGAGLFLRTVQNLRHVDVGFNANNLVLFRVNPQLNRYDQTRTFALYADMLDRIGTTPGVRSVALSQPALLSGSNSSTSIFVQGRAYPLGRKTGDDINRVVASPSFFQTMEIPLAAGRGFSSRDDETAPNVVVINQAAVRKYFPNQNPIGQRFGSSIEDAGHLEIVGVLRDAKYDNIRDAPPPTMYVPYRQNGLGSTFFVVFEVRTAADAAGAISGIRDVVRQIDPNLPLTNVSTQLEQVEQRFLQERVFAEAYTLFGGLALMLASIGLFGLLSYSVARRTNEIGIRLALGARREDVLRLVMGESLGLVLVGGVIGLAIALTVSRFISSLLFGVGTTDVPTMVAVMAVMVLVSALASYLPARRASRIDPIVALHCE